MNEFNIEDTIYLQYQKSKKFIKLLETFKKINPNIKIKEIYDKIFNLKTANTYGLDIWGLILNIGRTIELTSDDYFGFKSADYEPFNQAPFYNGKETGFYNLSDEPYRKVLLLVCARNTTNASLPELNKITSILFKDRGSCKVEKIGTKKLTFTFNFEPEPWEVAILKNESIMPIPACCSYTVIINNN